MGDSGSLIWGRRAAVGPVLLAKKDDSDGACALRLPPPLARVG